METSLIRQTNPKPFSILLSTTDHKAYRIPLNTDDMKTADLLFKQIREKGVGAMEGDHSIRYIQPTEIKLVLLSSLVFEQSADMFAAGRAAVLSDALTSLWRYVGLAAIGTGVPEDLKTFVQFALNPQSVAQFASQIARQAIVTEVAENWGAAVMAGFPDEAENHLTALMDALGYSTPALESSACVVSLPV